MKELINKIRQFIVNAINHKEIVGQYKEKLFEANQLLILRENKLKTAMQNYADVVKKKENLTKEINSLKQEITKLIDNKTVDFDEATQKWYDTIIGRYGWYKNYDGEGSKDVKHVFKLKNKVEGAKLVNDKANEIIDRFDLREGSKLTTIIEAVIKFYTIKKNWTYKYDKDLYGTKEFWAPADVSLTTNSGDCDDLAIVMNTLIREIFKIFGKEKSSWRLELTASYVLGEGGHAFNLWLHDDGERYVIESTYDLSGSFNKTWLNTPVRYNNLYYNFWGFARPDRSVKPLGITSFRNIKDLEHKY